MSGQRHWARAAAAGLALAMLAAPTSADEGFRLTQTCAGCHGTGGASPGDTIPIIGGQNAEFLAESLHDYQSGDRGYYVMKIIAAGYDDDQIDSIATWLSEQDWVSSSTAYDANLAAAGATVAQEVCDACHGRGGIGTDAAPRMAGQPAAYLANSGLAYKTGERNHPIASVAVSDIDDADIVAAAHYYASQR
jgi:cytochrome subunit of sulfide dehydrogenase